MIQPEREEEIHQVFDVTLILKGIHAIIEVIGGILLYFVSSASIVGFVRFFVRGEINENSHNIVANYLLHLAQSFGGSAKTFAAFYLLGHGIINGIIVVALWKEKLWAYPLSFIVLGSFIIYQLYLLSFHYSPWLIAFTILDIIIVLLVWHEYGLVKQKNKL